MSKRYLPITLSVELVRGCIHRCFFCNSWKEKEYNLMTEDIWESVKEVLQKVKVDNITPFAYGESVLHPLFYLWTDELLRLNVGKKLFNDLVLNTSGTFLDIEEIFSLVFRYPDSGFHRIHFSLDGISPKDWNCIGKIGNWQEIMEKVAMFLRYKRKYGFQEPLITISKVYQSEKLEEAEDFVTFFKKFFKTIGEKVKVYWDQWPDHSENGIYLRADTRFKSDDLSKCLRDNILIRADGYVYLCLGEKRGNFCVGRLPGFDMAKYLLSDEYKRFRKAGLNECRNCQHYC